MFYKNIKTICKNKNIMLGELERGCGYSTGYVSRAYTHTKRISLEGALRISEALGENLLDMCSKDYETEYEKEITQWQINELERELNELKTKLDSYK